MQFYSCVSEGARLAVYPCFQSLCPAKLIVFMFTVHTRERCLSSCLMLGEKANHSISHWPAGLSSVLLFLAVSYFISKRGLITFCRIMLNRVNLTTKDTVHMPFHSWLTFIQMKFLPHVQFVLFYYMHMNDIVMTCLPLVTERLHTCLSRKMEVCIMTAF